MENPSIEDNGYAPHAHRLARFCGPSRGAFTILEFLVVVSVMTVLLGLLFPAVQVARGTARRMQCGNNLHQIGLAVQSYHDSHRVLPAGWCRDKRQETAFGWGAWLLPYLAGVPLFKNIEFTAGVLSPANARPRTVTPSVFLCPSDIVSPTFALFEKDGAHHHRDPLSSTVLVQLPSANYVGVFGTSDPDDVDGKTGEGAFVMDFGVRMAELRRGLSHVFLVGERTAKKLPSTWLGIVIPGEDAPGRVVGNARIGPNRDDSDECEFNSRHPGCVNFLWADGHVDSVVNGVDVTAYQHMATRGN